MNLIFLIPVMAPPAIGPALSGMTEGLLRLVNRYFPGLPVIVNGTPTLIVCMVNAKAAAPNKINKLERKRKLELIRTKGRGSAAHQDGPICPHMHRSGESM